MEATERHAIKTEKLRYRSSSVGCLREELKNWKDGCPQRIAIQEILAERESEERRDSLIVGERQHRERQRLAYLSVMLSVTVAIISAASSYFAGISQRAQLEQRLFALEQQLMLRAATDLTVKPTIDPLPEKSSSKDVVLDSESSTAPPPSQASQTGYPSPKSSND